jgi:hypothetical protein
MDAERWQQIERLYHAALARPATERAAFVAEASAGDEELRSEVVQLLDARQLTTMDAGTAFFGATGEVIFGGVPVP